jgi:hypothetical protein
MRAGCGKCSIRSFFCARLTDGFLAVRDAVLGFDLCHKYILYLYLYLYLLAFAFDASIAAPTSSSSASPALAVTCDDGDGIGRFDFADRLGIEPAVLDTLIEACAVTRDVDAIGEPVITSTPEALHAQLVPVSDVVSHVSSAIAAGTAADTASVAVALESLAADVLHVTKGAWAGDYVLRSALRAVGERAPVSVAGAARLSGMSADDVRYLIDAGALATISTVSGQAAASRRGRGVDGSARDDGGASESKAGGAPPADHGWAACTGRGGWSAHPLAHRITMSREAVSVERVKALLTPVTDLVAEVATLPVLQQKAGKGAEGVAKRQVKEAVLAQQRVGKRVVTWGGLEYVLASLGREIVSVIAAKLAK